MTIAPTGEVWCGANIFEGQRQCYHRCPQPCQPIGTRRSRQQSHIHTCNTSPPHHVRSLSYRNPARESERSNTSWPSTQSTKAPDIPRLARCKEKYSTKNPPILELQGWARSRRQADLQSLNASDPSIPETWIPQGLTCWPFRGGEDPTQSLRMSILVRHHRGHWRIHQGMQHIPVAKASQHKGPFIPHDVPNGPWEKVAINVFQ